MKLGELHDKLFDVLCIIDDICRKEGVRYFLDSGTELGAVREHDFIPWDDDVDIKVTAEEYPAFKAAMEMHLPEHMHLAEPDAFAPGFYDYVVRIYDDRWLMRPETPEDAFYGNLQNRIGADVFITAKVPDTPFAVPMMVLKLRILHGLGMAHRYRIDYKKYTPLQKIQVMVLSTAGKFTNVHKLWKRWWRTVSRCNGRPCRRQIRANTLPMRLDATSWLAQAVPMRLRDREFPVPVAYDAELTTLYGNYMAPRHDTTSFIQHQAKEDQYSEPE